MYRVLGLLVTLFFISSVGGYSVESSKITIAKQEMKNLSKSLEMYSEEFKRYPSTEEGLVILTKNLVTDPSCDIRKIGFIKKLPIDPWGNEYQYVSPGLINSSSYDLWSFGADGIKGGIGLNSDCGNWESKECNKIQSIRNVDYTPLAFLSIFGLLLGLPIYLYKSISIWRKSSNLKSSLKGFHLGVLIYLTLAPVIAGGLLFSSIG